MSVFSTQLRLRNKDVNLYRRLRTSRLFELMQEASIRHTEELGMGREMTLDQGLLWMVTLQRAEIARMPEYDELITLESWPGETMHLLFPRYYRVLDEKGAVLLSASALWALVDQETRRMVFPDRHGVVIEGEVTGHEIALPSPPRRAQGEAVARFKVPFSYVDLNGHMRPGRGGRALQGSVQLCGSQRPYEQHPLLRPGGGFDPRRVGGAKPARNRRGIRKRSPPR